MAYTCWYYWIFEPTARAYQDDGSALPASTVDLTVDGRSCSLALFLSERGHPHLARLSMPGLTAEALPDECQRAAHTIREHLLSTLRISFDQEVRHSFAPAPFMLFTQDGDPPALKIRMDYQDNRPPLDGSDVKNAFIATWSLREQLRLFTDGTERELPVQYRFLSYYRIIELQYKKGNGKWNSDALDQLIQRSSVALTRNDIKDLRHQCAHITVRDDQSGEFDGVTHLESIKIEAVLKALPEMRELCRCLLNEVANGAFTIAEPAYPAPAR